MLQMPRLLVSLLLLTAFSLSLALTYGYRWQCHPEDAEAVGEILAILNWPLTGTDHCCHLTSMIQCNPNTSSVNSFALKGDDFNGEIPAAFGKLTNLESLVIHKMQNLHGPIPPSFANLTKLTNLAITWTNVSGPIPTWLNRLTNLENLDLSFNQLSGSIPPTLGYLPKLIWLQLDRNKLTGPIPESFGQLANLKQLYLSHNSLSGPIPKSLAQIDFIIIDLNGNQLVGNPSHLFNSRSKSLKTIILSRNLFNFDLTGVVFPSGLSYLDLSHNLIYGSIPTQIMELSQLLQLNVSYNRLCGPIPQGRDILLYSDSSSYMHNRCLCGPPLSAKC